MKSKFVNPVVRPNTVVPSDNELPDQSDVTFWTFVDHFSTHLEKSMPEIDVQAASFFMGLHRALDLIAYDTRQELHQELSPTAMRVLLVLQSVEEATVLRIAELTGMSRAATSSLLKRLEKDGHVARTTSEKDGRSVIVSPTREGIELCNQVYARYNERESHWFNKLTQEEATVIRSALWRLAANAHDISRRV